MRKAKLEVKEQERLLELLKRGKTAHIAIHDTPYPYIVTLNYGYKDNALYFHCAREGRKIDLLRKNNKVSFQIVVDEKIEHEDSACSWTTRFASLNGTAIAHIREADTEISSDLTKLMAHYGVDEDTFPDNMIRRVYTLKLDIVSLRGKSSL